MASSKNLSEKIAIMQVTEAGGSVIYTHPEGSLAWTKADDPMFNWGTSDYKVVADLPAILMNAADTAINYSDVSTKLFALERGKNLPNATTFASESLTNATIAVQDSLKNAEVDCSEVNSANLAQTDFFKILTDAVGGDPTKLNSCLTELQDTIRVSLKDNIYSATCKVIGDTIQNQINGLSTEDELYTNTAPTSQDIRNEVEVLANKIANDYHDTPDLTIIEYETPDKSIDCSLHKNINDGSILTISYNLDKGRFGTTDPEILRPGPTEITYNTISVTMDDLQKAIEDAISRILAIIATIYIPLSKEPEIKTAIIQVLNNSLREGDINTLNLAKEDSSKKDDALKAILISYFTDKLSKEKEERIASDNTITSTFTESIAKEKEERIASDNTITSTFAESIAKEKEERIAADAALHKTVTEEISTKLDAEVKRATEADEKLAKDINDTIKPSINAKLPLAGGTMTGDIHLSGNRIDGSDGNFYIGNKSNKGWMYVQNMKSQDNKWTLYSTNGNFTTDGEIRAKAVHNAVWNDLTDLIIVPENTPLEYGRCYITDGETYAFSSKYCQKGIIGIHSDTSGLSMGEMKGKVQLHIAVAGFVLAYVDKVYESGTPLTCGKNGCLTEIKMRDKIKYPERIIGTFWKPEKDLLWNGIGVNNRCWIKIK